MKVIFYVDEYITFGSDILTGIDFFTFGLNCNFSESASLYISSFDYSASFSGFGFSKLAYFGSN